MHRSRSEKARKYKGLAGSYSRERPKTRQHIPAWHSPEGPESSRMDASFLDPPDFAPYGASPKDDGCFVFTTFLLRVGAI